MKTNAQLKKIMQSALDCEYGFKPALADINLMESNDIGTYIAAAVKGHYYSFRSYKCPDGAIWTGAGTIEKQPEYDVKC